MCLKACLQRDTEQQGFCRQYNYRLYLLQETTLFEDLTLLENLEYACRLRQPVTTGPHQVHNLLNVTITSIASITAISTIDKSCALFAFPHFRVWR